MAIIETNGKYASSVCVNDDLYETLISNYNRWRVLKKGYVVTEKRIGNRIDNKKICFLIHREVIKLRGFNLTDGDTVDHKDWDKLNNRSTNLRVLSRTENSTYHDRTKVKGYFWNTQKQKYQVKVGGGKVNQIHIGFFTDEVEARKAYEEACKKHFGIFAGLDS